MWMFQILKECPFVSMFKVLLYDLKSPSIDYRFPQALPGEVVLSHFTQPSFLQWIVHGSGTRGFCGAAAVHVHYAH